MRVTARQWDALTALWHELSEFPASEAEPSLEHALRGLQRMIGSERIWWTLSAKTRWKRRRNRIEDWKVVDVLPVDASIDDQMVRVMMEHYAAGDYDEFTRRRLAVPGRCLCHRDADLMTRAEWTRDWDFAEARRPAGLDGTLVATYRVSEQCEAHVGLDRSMHTSAFTPEERDLLEAFMAGAQIWHREQCLVRGWIECDAPLAARERDVVQQLLTGATEKQIARDLGMTPRTVHYYVTELCRRFGVSGRRGLMALWLRRREPGGRAAGTVADGATPATARE